VAPELDFDSRALSPVDVFHFPGFNMATLALEVPQHQYRKWAIRGCFPRLLKNAGCG
jgi:hypothetical protein